MMLAVVRFVAIAICGYLAPRILVGLGMPLDNWANDFGVWVGLSRPWVEEWGLTTIGLVLAIILSGIEAWWYPVKRVWRKILKTNKDNDITKVNDLDLPLVEIDAKGRNYVRFELGKYDYQNFKITIEEFIPQIEGNKLYLYAGDDAGFWVVGYSILNLNEAEREEGEPVLAENLASNPTRPGQIEIQLYRPFIVGVERRISFKSYVYTQLKMYSKKDGEIMFKHSLEPITQIEIRIGKGNILSGVFRLYGMSGA